MIVDITNEVYTKIKDTLKNVTVLQSYPSTTPNFPCVIIEELSNNSYVGTKDSNGFNHSDVSLEINIFTDSQTRVSDAKSIRNEVDKVLNDYYGMNRNYSSAIPNFSDGSIYRYVMRYSFLIDSNKTIYRN